MTSAQLTLGVLRLLNLKQSESRHVRDLLAVQFFIGMANAYITIMAIGLFIKKLSIEEIPWAYIVVAITLVIINLFYEKLEHSVSPLQLLRIILGGYIVALVILWAGLQQNDQHYPIFILMVWSSLIYMITGYAFWGLVSQLFNIRESKRVFSVVGAGDMPAKLIGYLTAPILMKLVGEANLIWFAIAALAAGFLIFSKVISKKHWEKIKNRFRHHEAHHHHQSTHIKKKDIVSFFFRNELIFAISLLSLVSFNVFNFVDYTFLAEVKNKYKDTDAVYTFVAVFFALGRLIAIILKLVFTSRVIEKLGVIISLFITPVIMLAFCLTFFLTDNRSGYAIYVFGLMAMMTEVLRSTMQEPVFFILFQPLKEQLRLKGHIISKGYMLPPSLLIVGVSLILLNRTGNGITIALIIKILLINLVIWGLLIYFLRKAYLNTLRDSIQKGLLHIEKGTMYDEQTIAMLLEKAATGRDNEVIYALSLLENAGYNELPALLEKMLSHPDKEVRKYALDKQASLKSVNIARLRQCYQQESDQGLRLSMADLLCRHDEDFLSETAHLPPGADRDLHKVVIINLLNQLEFKYLFTGGEALNSLIHSQLAEDRELAVQIITELKTVRFTDEIRNLLSDPEPRIRKAAMNAACRMKITQVMPTILDMLNTPSEKFTAMHSLVLYGDELFDYILTQNVEAGETHAVEMIRLAGRTKGPHSTRYLFSRLSAGPEHNTSIVHALWKKGHLPETIAEINYLTGLMNQFLAMGNEKIKDFFEVPQFEDQEVLKAAIDMEIKSDLESALRICALLYQRDEYNRMLELIARGDHERLVNAIEMLDLVLPKKISRELNTLFSYVFDAGLKKRSSPTTKPAAFFSSIFHIKQHMYGPWTRAVSMYYSWKQDHGNIREQLAAENHLKDHYIVKETKDYILHGHS